jgi:hypothetical protein
MVRPTTSLPWSSSRWARPGEPSRVSLRGPHHGWSGRNVLRGECPGAPEMVTRRAGPWSGSVTVIGAAAIACRYREATGRVVDHRTGRPLLKSTVVPQPVVADRLRPLAESRIRPWASGWLESGVDGPASPVGTGPGETTDGYGGSRARDPERRTPLPWLDGCCLVARSGPEPAPGRCESPGSHHTLTTGSRDPSPPARSPASVVRSESTATIPPARIGWIRVRGGATTDGTGAAAIALLRIPARDATGWWHEGRHNTREKVPVVGCHLPGRVCRTTGSGMRSGPVCGS